MNKDNDLEQKLKKAPSKQTLELAARLSGLVKRIQGGDEQAFEEFYEASYNYVFCSIRAFSQSISESTVQELAQDAYIKMFTNIKSLRDPEGAMKWVKTISINTAKDYFRKSSVRNETLLKDQEESDLIFGGEGDSELADPMPVPEDIVENAATRKIVMEVLSALPGDQRLILMEFYFNETPVKDIAASLGMSEGAVKTKLSRTRKALKTEFEKIEKEQGIRLRSVGAVPLIIFLFYLFMRENPVSDTAKETAKSNIFASESVKQAVTGTQTAGKSMVSAASKRALSGAAKSAALSAGAKIGITAAAVILAAGIAVGVYKGTTSSTPQTAETQPEETAAAEESAGADEYGPKDTLYEFVDAVNAHDSEAILECFEEETVSMSLELEEYYSLTITDVLDLYFDSEGIFTEEISVSDVIVQTQDDDTAVITFNIVYIFEEDEVETSLVLNMVLEDEVWKIDLSD